MEVVIVMMMMVVVVVVVMMLIGEDNYDDNYDKDNDFMYSSHLYSTF